MLWQEIRKKRQRERKTGEYSTRGDERKINAWESLKPLIPFIARRGEEK
jgi:hypothetical protein